MPAEKNWERERRVFIKWPAFPDPKSWNEGGFRQQVHLLSALFSFEKAAPLLSRFTCSLSRSSWENLFLLRDNWVADRLSFELAGRSVSSRSWEGEGRQARISPTHVKWNRKQNRKSKQTIFENAIVLSVLRWSPPKGSCERVDSWSVQPHLEQHHGVRRDRGAKVDFGWGHERERAQAHRHERDGKQRRQRQ